MRSRIRLVFLVLSSLGGVATACGSGGGSDSGRATTGSDGGSSPSTSGGPGTILSDGAVVPSDCSSGEAKFVIAGDGGASGKIGGVAVDATNLYYVMWDGSVWKLPRCAAGGTAPTLIGTTPAPKFAPDYFALLAVDGTNAYVASQGGPIAALPLAGGNATTLVAGERVVGLTTDGTHVFYTTQAQDNPDAGRDARISYLYSVPVGGGAAPTLLATATTEVGMQGVAVDSAHVYYADRGDFGGSNGQIYSVPLTGGTPTPLSPKPLPAPTNMTLVNGWLYVCDQAGPVYRIPTSGGPSEVLSNGINNAFGIAVTPSDVYFTNTLVNDAWILHEGSVAGSYDPPVVFHGSGTFPNNYPSFGGLVSLGASIYFSFNGNALEDDAGTDGGTGPMLVRVTP